MSKTKLEMHDMDSEAKITLGLLNIVHDNENASQRSMADGLGIALGMANAYLKRCVKKGLIKISHAPANRYAYYLTPQGFTEKSRLTAEFLSQSLNLFRHARIEGAGVFEQCQRNGWHRIALYGTSDLTEILTLSARDFDVELIAVVSDDPNMHSFAGLPATHKPSLLHDIDAVVICDIRNPQSTFDAARETYPVNRILAPKFLGISKAALPADDEEAVR